MTPEPETDDREELEVVDGLPVLADARTALVEPVQTGVVPSRQAAALAATTFVAGAATVALVQRRKTAKVEKRHKRNLRVGVDIPTQQLLAEYDAIVGSNSFLVDVHLLRRD